MIVKDIRTTLEMIKIEHTLFALPFAFLGAVLAARGIPTAWQIYLDYGGDGRSALDGDGFQSHRGSRLRCPQPPNKDEGDSGRNFVCRLCLGVHDSERIDFFLAAVMLNRLTLFLSPLALLSVSGLLVHQALDCSFTPGAGLVSEHCAYRRVDRGARRYRQSHPFAAFCSGDALDGRIRRALRLSGFRIRSS